MIPRQNKSDMEEFFGQRVYCQSPRPSGKHLQERWPCKLQRQNEWETEASNAQFSLLNMEAKTTSFLSLINWLVTYARTELPASHGSIPRILRQGGQMCPAGNIMLILKKIYQPESPAFPTMLNFSEESLNDARACGLAQIIRVKRSMHPCCALEIKTERNSQPSNSAITRGSSVNKSEITTFILIYRRPQ